MGSFLAAPHSNSWECWKYQPSLPALWKSWLLSYSSLLGYRNNNTSSRSSKKTGESFPAWQCQRSFVCSPPISSHKALTGQAFYASPLILLMIFTDWSRADFSQCGIFSQPAVPCESNSVAAADGATAHSWSFLFASHRSCTASENADTSFPIQVILGN